MKSSQKLINMEVSTLIEQTRARDANPGGGALVILISNLALNLMLMMDKNDWSDQTDQAKVSYETSLKLSEKLTSLMQDDVDNFRDLMNAINLGEDRADDYVRAAKPLLEMLEINKRGLEILGFYLDHGKKSALTDGQIANDLLKTASLSALATIDLNLQGIENTVDYTSLVKKIRDLYEKNKEIIERRS